MENVNIKINQYVIELGPSEIYPNDTKIAHKVTINPSFPNNKNKYISYSPIYWKKL